MDRKEFLISLEELLDCPSGTLEPAQALAETGKWDSLNFVSFILMAKEKHGVSIAPAELTGCKTVADVLNLMNATKAK